MNSTPRRYCGYECLRELRQSNQLEQLLGLVLPPPATVLQVSEKVPPVCAQTGTATSASKAPSTASSTIPRGRVDFATGENTHWYVLDPLAAVGAVVLPYGYPTGPAVLQKLKNGQPRFSFPGYSVDGSTSPQTEAATLADLMNQMHNVWHNSSTPSGTPPIVILGHSHGGLVAYLYWGGSGFGSGVKESGVKHVFSLDSPINGDEDAALLCAVPLLCNATFNMYATLWQSMAQVDALAIQKDSDQTFPPIGTVADLAFDRTDPPPANGIMSQILLNCTLVCSSSTPAFPRM